MRIFCKLCGGGLKENLRQGFPGMMERPCFFSDSVVKYSIFYADMARKGGSGLRRFLTALTVCLLLVCGGLWPSALADSAASGVDMACTVNASGDCYVTMTVMLRLEAVRDQMTFPLPLEAKNIALNGTSISASRSGSVQVVDISRITRGYVGEASLRFEYTIPQAVKVVREDSAYAKKKDLQLTLPMLSGFELPIENLNFTITMPTSGEFFPRWSSIYRQESIASDLRIVTSGSQIIGSSTTTLNDHEGMTMTMVVPKEMFPTVSTSFREGNPEVIPMGVCAGLGLVYWLVFLFNLPMVPARTTTAPEGITAGELGSHLTLAGADLTGMVFSWAQLGYLLIRVDGGKVLLIKRMEMGNERSAFENKVFRLLFGNRTTVDATGNGYAVLCGKVGTMVPGEKTMHKGTSGNGRVFRGLMCLTQMFCGICVAMNLSENAVLSTMMAVILGLFGLVSAWLIQAIAYRTHLRGKVPVLIGLGCVLVWALLGFLCGQNVIVLISTLGQLLAGYFAAYGGRRSDLGRHDASLVLGLRRYVKRLPRNQVGRLLSIDPDYFYNLAPYALALGVLKPFGRAFGRRKLEPCPYLMTAVQGKGTGEDWARRIIEVADKMDAKARRMQVEKLIPVELPKITIERQTRR